MKYITQQSTPTIQVTFEMTAEELQLITQGIGNTSETSRTNAGMTKQQSKKAGEFYSALIQACKDFGVSPNE